MTKIDIMLGSTRPGRRADFELVDLADFALPLLDEEQPALFGSYAHAHTLRWAKAIARCDGFVFVTAEYDHSIPARSRTRWTTDYLYAEWNDEAAGRRLRPARRGPRGRTSTPDPGRDEGRDRPTCSGRGTSC